MRWNAVVAADLLAMQARAPFMALLGGDIGKVRAAADGELGLFEVPLVEYTIVSAVESERFAEVRIQWDVMARTDTEMVAMELELYRMFHRDTACIIGGLPMVMSQYVERIPMQGLQDGLRGASVEYLQQPARLRYVG